MKNRFCLVLALILAVLCLPILANAAGKAVITKEAFFIRPFLSYHAAEVYAEITNTGDKPVIFNGGLLELYDKAGNAIESSNLYSCYPEVLNPGESGYLYVTKSVDAATDKSYIDDYSLTVSGKAEKQKTTLRIPSEGSYGPYQRSKYITEYNAVALITNNTGELLRDITVVYALFDASDNLLFCDSTQLYRVGLPAGQTMEARTEVDSRIVDAWSEDGITPARIVTIAYVEKE